MSLTRADAEAELVDRCGTLLALVGKDGTTANGTNVSLNGPIREGLLSLGAAPAARAVADADLVGVTPAMEAQLFDVAELRCLRTIASGFTKVDQKISLGEQKLDQLRQGIAARIADLDARVRNAYGVGLASMSASVVSLDFATTFSPDEWGCELP